jgi:nitrilase
MRVGAGAGLASASAGSKRCFLHSGGEIGHMTLYHSDRSYKVAIVQHAPVFLNLEESLDKACLLVEEAAGAGARVIVFPETWLPGYPVWLDYAPRAALWDHAPAKMLYSLLVENSLTIPGRHVDRLRESARRSSTYLIMGAHERLGGTLYNTMLYLDRDGQSFQIHRKLVPTYTERLVWGRGDGSTLGVMPSEFGNLGGLICWEHWMPLARAAMHAQNETLHVAQWPAVRELHQIASRHYAFEGQCFVLAAGSVLSRGEILEGFHSLDQTEDGALQLLEAMPGQDTDFVLGGGSAVIAPDSSYLEGPILNQALILYADIHPERISEGHLVLDTQGHYARPDVFHLEVNDQPQTGVSFASQEER